MSAVAAAATEDVIRAGHYYHKVAVVVATTAAQKGPEHKTEHFLIVFEKYWRQLYARAGEGK